MPRSSPRWAPPPPSRRCWRSCSPSGVDVARLNFSHGRHEDHARMLDRIRAASRHLGKAVAVLQDLQGPKIRTGPLQAGKAGVQIESGAELAITTEGEVHGRRAARLHHLPAPRRGRAAPATGSSSTTACSSSACSRPTAMRVRTEVVEGGMLGEHKGINLPGVALRAEALSDKDREDIAFGLSHGVDYIGLSFVRTPEDVGLCRAGDGAGGPGGADHRQDREAGGARPPRRHHRRGRRRDGGARRPRRGDPARARARCSRRRSAARPTRPGSR